MENLEDEWLEWITTLSVEDFELLLEYWESDDYKNTEDELLRLEND